jgi:hypothetical protein
MTGAVTALFSFSNQVDWTGEDAAREYPRNLTLMERQSSVAASGLLRIHLLAVRITEKAIFLTSWFSIQYLELFLSYNPSTQITCKTGILFVTKATSM